jgi:hypothetical protein
MKALRCYEGTPRGDAWRRKRGGFTTGQHLIFDGNAGKLPAAFADCMSVILEPLEMVESEHFKGVRGRTFLGVLGLVYQLLLSAWTDCEEGRLTASSHHWRSIFESADYLLALWWDDEFARTWHDVELFENKKAEQAMQMAQRKLNEQEPGRGDTRYADRGKQRRDLQVFSHVSQAAVSWIFTKPPGGTGSFFVPEGYNGPENVRVAVFLVRWANEILTALSETIDSIMPDQWREACGGVKSATEAYVAAVEQATNPQEGA